MRIVLLLRVIILPLALMQRSILAKLPANKAEAPMIMRPIFLFVFAAALIGCKHTIQIVGEGDVYSSSGRSHCAMEESPCQIAIDTQYFESYSPAPRGGSQFSHWENCLVELGGICQFYIPAVFVSLFSDYQADPLTAVFTPATSSQEISINFPPPFGIYAEARLPIHGTYRSAAGHPAEIQVRVGDELVTTFTDQEGNWKTQLKLPNQLANRIEVTSVASGAQATSTVVRQQLAGNSSFFIDHENNIAYTGVVGNGLAADSLYKVYLDTGVKELIRFDNIDGESIGYVDRIRYLPERDVFVVTAGGIAVLDLKNQTSKFVWKKDGNFAYDALRSPNDIAPGKKADEIIVVGLHSTILFRMNIDTGEQEPISGHHIGSGSPFYRIARVAVSNSENKAYVLGTSYRATSNPPTSNLVHEVDLETGHRRLVLDTNAWHLDIASTGEKGSLIERDNMLYACIAGETLALDLARNSLTRLTNSEGGALACGDLQIVSSTGLLIGSNDGLWKYEADGGQQLYPLSATPPNSAPGKLHWHQQSQTLYGYFYGIRTFLDIDNFWGYQWGNLHQYNPVTGVWKEVYSTPDEVNGMHRKILEINQAGDTAYSIAANAADLIALDLTSGKARIIPITFNGEPTEVQHDNAVAELVGGTLYTARRNTIEGINVATGEVETVLNLDAEGYPNLGYAIVEIAFFAPYQSLYLLTGLGDVYRVDLSAGSVSLLSKAPPQEFRTARYVAMAIDPNSPNAYLLQADSPEIVGVSLAGGSRWPIPTDFDEGRNKVGGSSITYNASRKQLIIAAQRHHLDPNYLINIDPQTGAYAHLVSQGDPQTH